MNDIKDINSEAEKSLVKTGYKLCLQHPKSEAEFPCVSFFTLNERPEFASDNSEDSQMGWIQVDVWADKAKTIGDMSIEISSKMKADGWSRELSRDVPDEGEVYHKTMRFSKQFIL